MIIGTASCQAMTSAIYGLLFFNVVLVALSSISIIYLLLKLKKDNGILARMINKIAGDLPH